MKTLLLSILSYTLILPSSAQNTDSWRILNEPGNFETVTFINENVGWLYGLNTFLKTDDGGRSWYSLSGNGALLAGNDSLNFRIKALDFVNETTGWVITYLYLYDTNITTLQKTEDGGNSWDVIHSFFDLSLMDEGDYLISAVDDSTVYAFRYDGHANATRIIKTTDAGNTWKDISPIKKDRRLYSAWFKDAQQGLFIGSVILGEGFGRSPILGIALKTNNGGQSWTEKEIPEFEEIYDLQFINDSTCFFLGQQPDTSSRYGNYALCKSTDALSTWSKIYQDPSLYAIRSFFSLDEMTIWAVVEDSSYNKTLIKSTDGGGNMYFETAENGLASGRVTWSEDSSGAGIVSTHDGGQNWKLVWMYPNTDEYSYSINCIFALHNVAWAVGERGLIAKSTQPDSFILIDTNTDLPLNDVFFSDANHGWISGGYYNWEVEELQVILLKTSNGGESWKEFKFDKYRFYAITKTCTFKIVYFHFFLLTIASSGWLHAWHA